MAQQSVLPRGKSWSSGTTTGSFSSSETRRMKSELLKKLDEDSQTSSSEMKILEAQILDESTTLEKLKKFDDKRIERLRELGDDDDVKKEVPTTEKNMDIQDREGEEPKSPEEEAQVEKPSEGEVNEEVNEEVEVLRGEHKAAQSQIQYSKISLEKKRAELEVLSQKHQTLTELIGKEEKLMQAAEIDDSLQQSVAVHQEMRSLSSNNAGDSLKPGFTRPQLKGRVYHPVTQLRSRNLSRNSSQNGGGSSADLGRSVSLGGPPLATRSREPSRIKEPAEFEEKEGGGNRKRHKNSSFQQERERLHRERAKLEMEAKEKRSSLESSASFSSQQSSRKGIAPARGSSASSRNMISSPSSVFEGFGETPSLASMGPLSSGSRVSDSSESSSEFSTERSDSSLLSSAVKRLDFESFAKEDTLVPFPEDIASKGTSEEAFTGNGLDHDAEITREMSAEHMKVPDAEFSSEKGEEYLPSENGNEEFHLFAVDSVNDTRDESSGPGLSQVDGTEEVQGLEAEVSAPKSGDVEERSDIEMVGMQGSEDSSPKSGTEGKRESYLEVLNPESEPEQTQDSTSDEILTLETEPEQIQDATSDEILVANFEREVLEVFSEEFGNVGRETDAEKTSDETECHSLPGAAEDEVEEIDIPTEEFDSLRDAEEEEGGEEGEEEVSREEEVTTTRNRVEEIDVPEEDIEDFEDVEPADETSERQIVKSETGVDEAERPLGTLSEVSADDDGKEEAIEAGPPSAAEAPDLQENGLKSAEPSPEAGQLGAEEMSDERLNRRLEAENQMIQLSSQLSLLQKQVEEEVELHENSKNGSQLQHTSAEKEQLSKQVSFFADEVRGLRLNIDEIQRILHKEGGDFSCVEHWAKDLHSKCADQSAQLEHLGKQVSMLGKHLEHHLQLRVDIDYKLDKETQERQKVEAQLKDLSKALAITVSTMEREEEAVGDLIEHQKHLLVDQLKEAEKLRHIAEVRVLTLNNQIEQLEMVCDAARNIQVVTKYQDKAFKYGLQTLVQLFLLALGIVTLYSRVTEPLRASIVPT